MVLVRRVARPLLAASFITTGVEGLRDPAARVEGARKLGVPSPEQAVQINSALMIGAGVALASGRLPRLSGLALAGSMLPVTLGTCRFWEESDPAAKAAKQTSFVRNLGLVGGALLAAVDLEGRESVGHKAKRVSRRASRQAAKKAASAQKRTREILPLD